MANHKLKHIKKPFYLLGLLTVGLLLLNQQISEGYIAKRYSPCRKSSAKAATFSSGRFRRLTPNAGLRR